jgi:hypothetical protein
MMGLFDRLNRRRNCPGCQGPVNTLIRTSGLLCKRCNSYLDLVEDNLVLMDPKTVSATPRFGAALPWKDAQFGVQFTGAIMAPAARMTDALMTRRGDMRVLEAQWPDGCCVCGHAATRQMRLARDVLIQRYSKGGGINLGTTQLTLVAEGVPYCAEHAAGIAFGKVEFDSAKSGQPYLFGILFCWLGYRNAFCQQNPWPWPKY